MGMKKRGLFGSHGMFGGNGIVATREQEEESRRLGAMFPGAGHPMDATPRPQMPAQGAMADYGAMTPGMGMDAPQGRSGPDWRGIGFNVLGNVGDAIAQHYGAAPVYAPQREAQAAAAQRQAEQQRARAAALADYRAKLGIEQEFAQPETDAFDRAMSRAGIAPGTPEYARLSREHAERTARGPDPLLQGAPNPGGGTYTGPYSAYAALFGNQGGGQGNAPDTLPPDFDFGGSGQSAPAQPLRGPRPISQREYQDQLRAFNGDQRSMNIWMRNNNVIVGN